MSACKNISTLLATLCLTAPVNRTWSGEITVGTFEPESRYEEPAFHAPAHSSRFYSRTLEMSGGRAQMEILLGTTGRSLVWILSHSGDAEPTTVQAELRSPDGSMTRSTSGDSLKERSYVIEESDLELPPAQSVIELKHTIPGAHRLEIIADPSVQAVTVAVAEPQSDLVLKSWAGPLSRQPGESILLNASLSDGGTPLTGALVSARLAAPGNAATDGVVLHDDGSHDDGAAADGVYGAVISDVPSDSPGFWTVRFEAEGQTVRGARYARTGSGAFVSEPGSARLLDGSIRVKLDRSESAASLRVETIAEVRVPGRYRLDVIVAGRALENGARESIAWAELTESLKAGRNELTLEIPFAQLGSAEEGPVLLDIRLLGLDQQGVAGRAVVETR